uniref:Cadherin domain-containing protein n=1 Tax=Stegastes partitus TaxID=144197 RepID=A0A3B5A4F8_9TELE
HWITPPKLLHENEDYTELESIARIHSDWDDGKGNLVYSLKGIGASRHPFHVFVVNPDTGLIRVTKVLDREHLSFLFQLTGVARFNNGSQAEENIDIRFKIVDENDNAPVFGDIKPGEVNELSPRGTLVMKVNATDADEPGNNNSMIAYSIIEQRPPDDMFYMDRNGNIYVNKLGLDREV